MSKISDIIETFILEQMQDSEYLDLSRNELANFFNCAPSQINYVLSTRFTEPMGFVVESHRGGGGYIRLVRVNLGKDDYLNQLITRTLINEIDFPTSIQIIKYLIEIGFLDENSAKILTFAISPNALKMPLILENKQRANILRNVIINAMREE